MTEITNLDDDSLLKALTDETPRWICVHPSLDGKTWSVPDGSAAIGPNKTVDCRGVHITCQYGYPNNALSINSPPVKSPPKTGQLRALRGQFIMAGITQGGAWLALPVRGTVV